MLVGNTRFEVIGMAFHLLTCLAQGIGDLLSTETLVRKEDIELRFQAARSVSQRITSSMSATAWS